MRARAGAGLILLLIHTEPPLALNFKRGHFHQEHSCYSSLRLRIGQEDDHSQWLFLSTLLVGDVTPPSRGLTGIWASLEAENGAQVGSCLETWVNTGLKVG